MAKEIACWVLILASAWVSMHYAPVLPERVATHFDAAGNPNGWMGRTQALIFGPAVALGMYVLLTFLIWLGCTERNVLALDERTAEFMRVAKLLVVLLLTAVHASIVLNAAGMRHNPLTAMAPVLSVMLGYLGWAIMQAKRNWMMGVRVPWTLVDEEAWRLANRVMGYALILTAVTGLAGMALPRLWVWLFLAPLVAGTVLSMVWSYIVYRRRGAAKG
ncbi:MAG: DUF1648 domain-containing protein [Armatimonadota bacterium]